MYIKGVRTAQKLAWFQKLALFLAQEQRVIILLYNYIGNVIINEQCHICCNSFVHQFDTSSVTLGTKQNVCPVIKLARELFSVLFLSNILTLQSASEIQASSMPIDSAIITLTKYAKTCNVTLEQREERISNSQTTV